MKECFDKWLVIESSQFKSHILYSDISAFQYSEQDLLIRIFLRGASSPVEFKCANKENLLSIYQTMCTALGI